MKQWSRAVSRFVLFVVLISLGVGAASAQFLSGIQGTVTDPTGAAIPGATVTITNTQLGVTSRATTNSSGYFHFSSIAAATYNIRIVKKGFQAWRQDGLVVAVGETRSLSPTLKLGQVSQQVTVSATAAAVNVSSPTTQATISNRTVRSVPLVGQNVYGLAALTPGVTGSAVNSADNFTNEYAVNVNAAGLRQEQNSYSIDGAWTDTPSRGGGSSISPNPEIVQSVNIKTNNFDAGKGRNAGAVIDIFTKSGTNRVHGAVDYYFLNNNLSSRTEFEQTVPVFQRNEIAAALGGPIIKNKLFYFGAIDVLRSSTTSAYQATVETQALDNWVEANLPNTLAAKILKAAPPQHFPTSGLETVQQVENSTPGYYAPPAGLPANLEALGTTNISYSVPKDGYQYNLRGDYYKSSHDRFYAEFMRTHDTSEGATARPNLNDGEANSSDFANLDWTHTFNPNLLNEARAWMIRPEGADLPTPSMYIPYINVTGLYGFSNWGPGIFTQTTVGWRDVLTAVIKNHTLTTGFAQFNIRENAQQTGANDRPTYNFNNLIDFIQDKPTSESATPVDLLTRKQLNYARRYRTFYTGAFVQDDWQMTHRFALNMGVRADILSHYLSILSPKLTNFDFGSGSTYDQQIANGSMVLKPNPHLLDHPLWLVTPRVGFAWDVFGNGKTAVRGGFGLFANQPPYLHFTDITANNLPVVYTPSYSVYQGTTPNFHLCSPPTGFVEDCPISDISNVQVNSRGAVPGQRTSQGGYSPNLKMGQVDEWTLSVQQQLRPDLVAEVNYSGTAAHHEEVFNSDINRFAGDLIKNKGQLTRLNPYFAGITYGRTDGNSFGNYGSVEVRQSYSHGFSIQGIYTFGKVLDYYSTSNTLDSGSITTSTNVIQNGDLKAQRGRADFDIRNQFTAAGTWNSPDSYRKRWERNVLGGWKLGGVWVMHSGLPFTVYTSAAFSPVFNSSGQVIGNKGGDYNADGYNYDVPDVPSFGSSLGGQSPHQYLKGIFSASAFPTPALGKEGNLGRNTYNQPGFNNVDLTAGKQFTTGFLFGDKLHMEFMAEFYNLFNRVNLHGVNSDLSSSLFGHSTDQLPARSIQMHLRARF